MLKIDQVHMIHSQLPRHQPVITAKKEIQNEKLTFRDILMQTIAKK
ncbi:hypothetical protein JOD82_002251 [Paenibacillus sp. 1182]|nr:hypothetical protein [Paenibacillus sp. 1182]